MPTETPQPEKPKKPPVENSLPTDPTESGDPVKETK
jgi:hypothetical protein